MPARCISTAQSVSPSAVNSPQWSPPQAASIGDMTWIIYLPRGNADRKLQVDGLGNESRSAQWYNPRSGEFLLDVTAVAGGTLPQRPHPEEEDWVLVVTKPPLR
jgi:hypothetical protein